MCPYLFHGTPYELITWDVCCWTGVIVGSIFGLFIIKPKDFKLSLKVRLIVTLGLVVVGMLGGRLVHIFLNLSRIMKDPNYLIHALLNGPSASLGTLFFDIIFIMVLKRKIAKNIGYLQALDFAIPILYLQLIFIRIGCFFNGCCSGALTKVPWGFKFNGSHVARHPTQLYSIIALVLAIFMTIKIYRKDFPAGTAFFSSIALYSFFRFFIELLRVDSFKVFNNITFAPLFMSVFFIFSLLGLILNLRSKNGKPVH